MSRVATSATSAGERTDTGRAGVPGPGGPGRLTLAVAAVLAGVVLAAQIPLAIGLLHPAVEFEADHAKRVLAVNLVLAAITVLAAATLPRRQRVLALLPGAIAAAAMVGAAVTLGGHLWDYGTAALTLAAAWWLGRVVLRILHVPRLRGVMIVELVIGLGVEGLVVLVLGRLSILEWWTIGALTIAAGLIGSWAAASAGWARRDSLARALLDSRVAAACAGLLLLQVAWATVWLSAPEIMYDALYAKAYLPQLWAHTHTIGPLLTHPVLNVTGLTQYVAVAGHALGAPDVGRELQMLMWGILVATVWWWGRRSVVGPLAALAVGIVPQVVWQSTTAFDDLMLTAGAVALTIAVLRTADGHETGEGGSTFALALAIGALGGACIWLKLNQLAVAVVLVAGWVVLSRPRRALLARAAGVGLGGLVIAGPEFIVRWIDTGNPVFPSYNTIFKSPHYPLVNEQYNFPYWQHTTILDALKAPYEVVVHPWLMNDSTPAGAFGLLVAAVAIAALVGWRHRGRRDVAIAWLALVVGLLAWWIQFRYLRYALPAMMVGVLLTVTLLRGWRPGRATTAALLAAAGVASTVYLPSTVASFWNVPHRNLPFAAAFGRWDESDYLRTVFPEKDTLDVYQRVAPPGSLALSDAHERTFLVDRDLSPFWEVSRLLEAPGPLPTTGDAALRRMRAMGIGWAVVSDADQAQIAWAAALLREHGEVVFSDRGWRLYRLVDRPTRPRPLASCDVRLRGTSGCWAGRFDRIAGLRDGESPAGASRRIRVCAGETLAVELRTAAGGDPSQVLIDSDSGSALSGHEATIVAPNARETAYATAPPGTRTMNVTLVPGAAGGAIESARTGVLGHCRAP
jgi:hypothetical protein